jgi:hypothetical protein
VATVVGSGASATVTAVAPGSAAITATDGAGATADCAVTVAEDFFVISGDNVIVEDPVLQPNVYEVAAGEIESLSFADESDSVSAVAPQRATLSGAARVYQAGDVIVAGASESSKYGFAAVVESAQANPDGTQSLALRQAKFLDILSGGDIFFSLHAAPYSSGGSANPPQFAENGVVMAASVSDIWGDFINGNISAELPLDIPFPEVTIPSSIMPTLDLKGKISDVFKGSAKLETESKVRSSFSFLLSIEGSVPRKIALHFPYTVENSTKLELKGAVPLYEDDYKWTPPQDLDLGHGAVVLPVFGVPILIPWTLHVGGILDIKVDGGAGLDVGFDTVFNGDAGFYWDVNEWWNFPLINPLPKLAKSEATISWPSVYLSTELGVGPKFTLDLCLMPFSSATMTVGAKYETDFLDTSNLGVIEGKFKTKLTADLLELFAEGLSKIPGVNLDELKFSLNVIDWTFLKIPLGGGTDVWDGTVDTSWYENNPAASSYAISKGSELAGLAYLVSNGTQNFRGRTVTLVGDIDLADRQWTPIGGIRNSNSTYPFYGTFDGGGHTISNLAISGEDYIHHGLFSYVSSPGVVKNVKLAGVNIDGSSLSAGGIAGRNGGTITGCGARGKVTASGGSDVYTGGVIGSLGSYSVSIANNRFSQSGTGQEWGIGYDPRQNPRGPSNDGCTPY